MPGHNFTLAINLLYLYSFLFEISCIYFDSLIFWQLVKITLKFWNPSIFFLHECTGKSQIHDLFCYLLSISKCYICDYMYVFYKEYELNSFMYCCMHVFNCLQKRSRSTSWSNSFKIRHCHLFLNVKLVIYTI